MVNTEKKTALVNALTNKFVAKESGKGLSTNDYTTEEKTKLAGIEAQANKTVVDNSLSSSSENPVQNKIVKGALDLKADSDDLATVATTGDYDDLTDKPTISSLGGDVTVEKQTTAETGFLATYYVKQGGSKVGASINIPKDFLVKSASLETCTVDDDPVEGYVVGDKYLWINYLKGKVVEIRNLNVDINTKELVFVIKSFLQSLYYDKEISISSKTFTNINKLYDMALENANDISETLDKNEFVIIGLKDCKGKIIKLSDELTEQIKSLL